MVELSIEGIIIGSLDRFLILVQNKNIQQSLKLTINKE